MDTEQGHRWAVTLENQTQWALLRSNVQEIRDSMEEYLDMHSEALDAEDFCRAFVGQRLVWGH